MATLVESVDIPGNIDQLQKDLREATQPDTSGQQQQQQQKSAEGGNSSSAQRPEWCPEKFWDAAKGEVLYDKMGQSYTNLESSYGRIANDLGTQRKLTDKLLDLKRETDLQRNTPPAKVEIKGTELLENPSEALDRYLAAREAARESETAQRLASVETSMAAQAFIAKHPDYNVVANEPGFVEWVQATPYRARLGKQAAAQDFGAADELLSEYKDRKRLTATPQKGNEEDGKRSQSPLDAARSAALESANGSGGGNDGSGKKPGKVYRRVDLLELRRRNPEAYYDDVFQSEILRAYSEGRVK